MMETVLAEAFLFASFVCSRRVRIHNYVLMRSTRTGSGLFALNVALVQSKNLIKTHGNTGTDFKKNTSRNIRLG